MCIFCNPEPLSDPAALSDAQVLAAEQCPNLATRVPATIVTGFLGAGKTTLVNWLLQGSHGQRFCVLQNEFGSVPIDDALIVKSERFADVAVVTLPTGCVCCKVRGDLVEGLRSLARNVPESGQHFDAVVIETSGLSEVAPVAQTFFADRFVQRNFRLDAVVAVVDARTAPAALTLAKAGGAAAPPPSRSYAADDDSDDEEDVEEAGAVLSATCVALDSEAQTDEVRAQAARLLCEQLCLADVVLLNKMDTVAAAAQAELAALVRDVNGSASLYPCERARVDLASILHVNAFSVSRAVQLDSLFLSRGKVAESGKAGAPAGSKAGGKAGTAAFAFATPPPDPGDPSGRAHLHAAFGSCGVEAPCELDELAFSTWLEDVFAFHGSRLYRVKGIAFFRGIAEPSAVQCVGSHIDCERMDPTACDAALLASRRTRLVFIGQIEGLEEALAESFAALP